MTLPTDAADPHDPDAPEDLSQTSGFPLPSSQARGEDLREDLREEEREELREDRATEDRATEDPATEHPAAEDPAAEDPATDDRRASRERVLQVSEPTTESRPGGQPDESQGPP
jgi:hypothetical protein